MDTFLNEMIAFERISVIAKLASLAQCNHHEREIILLLIEEIAETECDHIKKKSAENRLL